ncbi:MAG: 16S rRNA (guanine(527)-N(7))-methyltransferase RsmG [Ginsengibacter sp.]
MEIISKYFDDFTEVQSRQFSALKGLYVEWNQKINVISRKDMDNFYERHVLHSLAIATQFNFPVGYRILDLGAGGGFPGIPLAIFFPEVNFLLVDSINKKLNVVKEVATAIGLTNVETLHSRVEDIKNQKFNIVVSRAVAPLKDLWFWSRPLLMPAPSQKPSGLICLKGGDLSVEIAESGLRPRIWEIDKIFEEEYFEKKFILNTRIT